MRPPGLQRAARVQRAATGCCGAQRQQQPRSGRCPEATRAAAAASPGWIPLAAGRSPALAEPALLVYLAAALRGRQRSGQAPLLSQGSRMELKMFLVLAALLLHPALGFPIQVRELPAAGLGLLTHLARSCGDPRGQICCESNTSANI